MGDVTSERAEIFSAKTFVIGLGLGVAEAPAAHWVLSRESGRGWKAEGYLCLQ